MHAASSLVLNAVKHWRASPTDPPASPSTIAAVPPQAERPLLPHISLDLEETLIALTVGAATNRRRSWPWRS